MSKGVKSNSEVKNTSLVKEVTGMALVLFSVLAFLCLVTGDALFYTLGFAVRGFLLGSFGYYAYFVLVDAALLGVFLTTGKYLVPRDVRKKYFAVRVALFAVFAIVHLAASHKAGLGFGEQFSAAYTGGAQGYATATVFGVLGTLVTASIINLVSVFGSYALYSLIVALSLFYAFGNAITSFFAKDKKPKTKKARVRRDRRESEAGDPSDPDPALPAKDLSEPFFFDEGTPFERKTKKDIANGAVNDYSFFEGEFYFKNSGGDPIGRAAARPSVAAERAGRESDDDGKIDLRTRKDSVGGMGRDFSDYGYAPRTIGDFGARSDVSDTVSRDTVVGGFEETDDDRRVYTVPINDGERPRTVISGDLTPDDDRDTSVGGDNAGDNGADVSARGYFDKSSSSDKSDRYSDVFADEDDDDNGDYNARVSEIRTFTRDDEEEDPSSRFDDSEYKDLPPASPRFAPRSRTAPERTVSSRLSPGAGFGFDGGDAEASDVIEEGEPIENMPADYKYNPPPITLLNDYTQDAKEIWDERNRQSRCAETIVKVIKSKRNIDVKVENVVTGCAVTRFEISIPEPHGPSEIFSLRQDLAFRLQVGDELRIYSVPYTSYVGIEIANLHPRTIGLKDSLLSDEYAATKNKKGFYFVFGEDILGHKIILDVCDMPHLLICGTTGSGKSVCLNVFLLSLLFRYSPEELRFIIIDPKLVEFENYRGIPHLIFNEILSTDDRTVSALEWCVAEMERRYELFRKYGCKNLNEYKKIAGGENVPYLIILVDEYADLIMAQQHNRKRIELCVDRIAQKARTAGMSLILATQRASVSILPGNTKNNIACRICFQTASAVDSRVVIDDQGGEKLLGKGDALYKTKASSVLKRGKGAFMDDDEIKRVIDYVKENNKCYFNNKILKAINDSVKQPEESGEVQRVRGLPSRPDEVDEDYKLALRFAITRQVVSGSSLRTMLRIGYNKAASIIAWMEKMQYISPILENKMRKVYITREEYESVYGEFIEDDF